MLKKYNRLLVTFVGCLTLLTISAHDEEEESTKATKVIQVDVSDVLGLDDASTWEILSVPIAAGIVAMSDDLSFQYIDGSIHSKTFEGTDGKKDGGTDTFHVTLDTKYGEVSVGYMFHWETVVIAEDSNTVTLGLQVNYELGTEVTVFGVTIDLNYNEDETIPLGVFPLYDAKNVVDTHSSVTVIDDDLSPFDLDDSWDDIEDELYYDYDYYYDLYYYYYDDYYEYYDYDDYYD